jgi:hypothetical protein
MIGTRVSVTDGASPELAAFISALTGPEMVELNTVAARAATNAAREFHAEFDKRGGWRATGGGGSAFGADVAAGWNFRSADATGATIGNDADHYAHKVRGGTIRPKRVSALTIPIAAEAHGRRAADYEIFFRVKLFRVKGKNVLFENRDGKLRAVYALVKSVTQGPWPEAVPPLDVLGDAFRFRWREELAQKLLPP